MYLKSIYIQGFKSFANKTKIEFNNKITAVVGPNGSGKSNISDAIMWVLGETSIKNLRGSKMEDVIFSGTDKRKALGLAEVTIVFDNSDKSLPLEYKEVSVTRKMYRSLESEYLINNVKCRLKDIRELFFDTGIGKDGYSLIGQGKIESILSNKPDQRRAIFEEAAGISKFKMRKQESQNKLKRTQDNIVRLNDIIEEIEKREGTLKVESENAKKYKEYFAKLKDVEVTLAHIEIKKYEENLKKNENQIIEIQKEIINIQELIERLQKEKEEIERKIVNIESELDIKLKAELEDTKKFERKIASINLYEERINNISKSILDKEREEEILKIEIQDKSELLKEISTIEYEEKIQILKTELLEKEEKSKELKNKLLEKEEKLKVEQESTLEIHKKINEIKSNISLSSSLIEEKKYRIDNVNKNLKLLNENNKEIIKSLEEYREKEKINLGKKENLIEEESLKKDLLRKNQEKLQQTYSKSENLKNELDRKSAKYKALYNIAENYDGYNKGVKLFMNFRKKHKLFEDSLIGPVAENFKVSKEYETAISVALGGALQNIIIDKEENAKEMLSLLIREKFGRVTFLPVDSVNYKEPSINISAYKNSKIIGFADELIEYDKKYENIFKNLLARVIIAKDFDSARELSSKINRTYRIVTLKGDSLNIGGSITGGSTSKVTNDIISRKNDLIELKNEIKEIQNDYDEQVRIKVAIEKEKEIIEKELSTIQNNISKYKEEEINLKNTIYSLNTSKENNDGYLEKFEEEKLSLFHSLKEDENNKEDLEKKLSEYELKLNSKINFEDENQKEYENIKTEVEATSSEISELRIAFLNLENQIKNKLLEKENIRNNIKETQIKIEKLIEENIKLNKEKSITEEELEKLKNEKGEFEKFLGSSSEKLNEIRKEKENLSIKLKDKIDNLEKEKTSLFTGEKKETKLISDKEKIDINISNIIERLQYEYNITKDEVEEKVAYKSIKELRETSEKSKIEIQKLGEVNLFAIEEYEQVKERLEFNTEQRRDLLQSKEEINKVLKELDKEMRIKFVESMEKTSKYFNEIFKKLFNGGKAEIEIEEGNILEGGIEIKAQPPGKKLQSLSLLSGGERSLTAVALLFALLEVRPAPFCILDEIDAALDDANIKRYADYLLTLKDIQFIIITHRKLTMEIANILYGVTMEEKGISKIISVELTKEN